MLPPTSDFQYAFLPEWSLHFRVGSFLSFFYLMMYLGALFYLQMGKCFLLSQETFIVFLGWVLKTNRVPGC